MRNIKKLSKSELKELARALEISQKTLVDYVNGKHKPPIYIQAANTYLGVNKKIPTGKVLKYIRGLKGTRTKSLRGQARLRNVSLKELLKDIIVENFPNDSQAAQILNSLLLDTPDSTAIRNFKEVKKIPLFASANNYLEEDVMCIVSCTLFRLEKEESYDYCISWFI